MKAMFALATVGVLAVVGTAFAQDAGEPGAVGVGPAMTGSNPPVDGMRGYGNDGDYDGRGYGYGPVPMLREGRSAAEDAATPVPETVRGSQSGQRYRDGW